MSRRWMMRRPACWMDNGYSWATGHIDPVSWGVGIVISSKGMPSFHLVDHPSWIYLVHLCRHFPRRTHGSPVLRPATAERRGAAAGSAWDARRGTCHRRRRDDGDSDGAGAAARLRAEGRGAGNGPINGGRQSWENPTFEPAMFDDSEGIHFLSSYRKNTHTHIYIYELVIPIPCPQ